MTGTLSILLIAHNEEEAVGPMLQGLSRTYDREILEIKVVDDASTDQTAAIVEDWAARNPKIKLIRRTPPCGVGRALKTGFANISPRAEYALTMDSDFVENINQVRLLINAIEKGNCDGVIGSRFVEGGRVVRYPFFKRLMNRLFHRVVRILFHVEQNDLTNNFKLYRANIFRSLPWKSDGFAMNAETGLLPILFGYRLIEVPVVWVDRDPEMGRSKFGLLKHGGGYLRVILYALRIARSRKRK
ncbi:MAG TPA: glycosyltransferase [Chthoniobacterales bacterium]|nr:glycosyltransferase [Chthoniobacterales bacterium]